MKPKIYKNWNIPEECYQKEKTEKKQITIFNAETGTTTPLQAYSYMIDRRGRLHKYFDDDYFGNFLDLTPDDFASKKLPISLLNHVNIGIALENFGPLMKYGGLFFPVCYKDGEAYPDKEKSPVPEDRVFKYEPCAGTGYRGFCAYEKYTESQLSTLKTLLVYLQKKHNIPANYKSDMWFPFICKRALQGEPGIYSYTSFSSSGTGCFPQRELIQILKSL